MRVRRDIGRFYQDISWSWSAAQLFSSRCRYAPSTLQAVRPGHAVVCRCGNPLRLRIQAQPYELVNHLDTPVTQAIYDQDFR